MAESLKGLLEARNEKISSANKIIAGADEEKRALTDDETAKLAEYREQVTTLDNSIKNVKEFRAVEGTVEPETPEDKKEDEPEVNESEKETRSVELYLRGKENTPEYRDLQAGMTAGNAVDNTAGNGGVTIPESVYSQIVKKLEQLSPVFKMVEQLPSQTGHLTIARETTSSDDVGFVGEGSNAKALTAALKTVTLTQKRVAASFQLTNDLINDSAVDVVNYAVDRVSRAIARTIAREILVGPQGEESADSGFKPIIGDADIATVALVAGGITVENLIDMYSKLHQAYQTGAAWVVSKAVFQEIAKLKDGDGRYLIFQGIVDGNPDYRLFNAPVYIDDALDKAANGQQLIFGNFNEGYAVMVKKAMSLVHVTQDTTQALAGGHLVVMDSYLDGAVKNPDAFIIGAVAAPKA